MPFARRRPRTRHCERIRNVFTKRGDSAATEADRQFSGVRSSSTLARQNIYFFFPTVVIPVCTLAMIPRIKINITRRWPHNPRSSALSDDFLAGNAKMGSVPRTCWFCGRPVLGPLRLVKDTRVSHSWGVTDIRAPLSTVERSWVGHTVTFTVTAIDNGQLVLSTVTAGPAFVRVENYRRR